MKPIDFSTLLLPYENMWVVISKDNKKVLGSGKNLDGIPDEIIQKGFVMKVPEFGVSYSFQTA